MGCSSGKQYRVVAVAMESEASLRPLAMTCDRDVFFSGLKTASFLKFICRGIETVARCQI